MASRGDFYALLIGINEYESRAVRALQFAVADVLAFGEFLRDRGSLSDQNCVVLSHPTGGSGLAPRRAAVLKALTQFTQAPMAAEDTFILYFAGHGFAAGENGYLLTVDSDPALPELLEETAIPLHTLQRFTRQIAAGQQLLILDACRNEPSSLVRDIGSPSLDAAMARDIVTLARGPASPPSGQARQARAILSACWEGQVSYEHANQGQGWFCHNLLGTLRDYGSDRIDVAELTEAVRERMRQNAWRELPEACDQEPHLVLEGRSIQLPLTPVAPPTPPPEPPRPVAPAVTAADVVPLKTRAELAWEQLAHLQGESDLAAEYAEADIHRRNADTFLQLGDYPNAKLAYETTLSSCEGLQEADRQREQTKREQEIAVVVDDAPQQRVTEPDEPASRLAESDISTDQLPQAPDKDSQPPIEPPREEMSPQQKFDYKLHARDFHAAQDILSEHGTAEWAGQAKDDWRAAMGNEISWRADQICEYLRKRRVYRAQKSWGRLKEYISLAPEIAAQHSAEITRLAESVIWAACRGMELASLESMAVACAQSPAVDAKVRNDLAILRPRLRNIVATLDQLNRQATSKNTIGWLHKMRVRGKIKQLEEEYSLPKNWVRDSLVSQVDRWADLLQLLYPKVYPQNEYGLELKRGLLLMNEDKHLESAEHFLRAIQLEPDSAAIAHNNYAWLFVVSEDPRFSNIGEALEHAKRAVELCPQPFILDTLAEVQRKAGHLDDAIATMQLAVEKETDPANAADWSQKIQEFQSEKECGDSEEAIAAIRQRRSLR